MDNKTSLKQGKKVVKHETRKLNVTWSGR